jgi:hypothetical protein
MQITRKYGSFVVVSPRIVALCGLVSIGTAGYKNARACAIFPLIFVRKQECATPTLVNHERIHFAQQLETLFIGLFLMKLIEYLYSRLLLSKNISEVYLFRASEQEAYRNQNNLDYLRERKPYRLFKYKKDKKRITFKKTENGEPEVIIT